MAISKKLRFEVFKRDKFKCQYCGKNGPDGNVVLEVDHIEPVSKGGTDDITNLITSCFSCNRGKGARPLSDNTVIQKKRAQAEELEELREQRKLFMEWIKELSTIEDEAAVEVAVFIRELANKQWDFEVEWFLLDIKQWIKKYGFEDVVKGCKIMADSYFKTEHGLITEESISYGLSKLPGILKDKKLQKEDPKRHAETHLMYEFGNKFRYHVSSTCPRKDQKWKLWEVWKRIRCVNKQITPDQFITIIQQEYANNADEYGSFYGAAVTLSENNDYLMHNYGYIVQGVGDVEVINV